VSEGVTPVTLLARVFEQLTRRQVPVCISHAHADLATVVTSDVDCVIPATYSRAELLTVLSTVRVEDKPVRVVQWFDDRAQYIAVAGGTDRSPVMVQLHVSPDFEVGGRVYYTADELIESRRAAGVFYVTPPEIEFACVLLNRLTKGALEDRHTERLSSLYQEAPEACERQLLRFWPQASCELIASDALAGNWTTVRQQTSRLLQEAQSAKSGQSTKDAAKTGRKIARWLRPKAGFHVVFLGPDGVGKSTVIEQVRDAISPAFLHTSYHTFAPSLIPHRYQPEKPTPHALPPRSFAASLVKAAWWSVCYTAGYMATIHPERVRGGFAMNHRYLLDAIVDPKRYRYSGPVWLLKAIWGIAPKPDLLFLLDAPPEVIQARKKEVPFEETARQQKGYRALVEGLPYGRIINAARPLDKVVSEVNGIILKHLEERVIRTVSKGA
jgi:hypothetical protein